MASKKAAEAASNIGKRRKAALKEPSGGYLARRQALLEAAAGVFRAKGFDAVRMDDVADQLGVNRATLYYYFPNKEQLFRAVIAGPIEENVERAEAIAASEGTPGDKIRELLVALFDSYDRHYPLHYVYVQEDMQRVGLDETPDGAKLLELGRRYDAVMRSVVEEGIACGDFVDEDRASLISYAIIGAANWSHRWFSPSGDLNGREVGELFADIFLKGLLRGPARRRAKRPIVARTA